jgi:hypothetical protein
MALKLLQPGGQPLGQFDCLDADLSAILGGEVMTFGTAVVATDKGASDVADGYLNASTTRAVVKLKKDPTTASTLMLSDDGTSGYGTLFGTVVGGTVGRVVTGGAVLGPSSQTGSGKVTCWMTPGLYAVTLDACDMTTSTGLVTNNATCVPGCALGPNTSGLLTPTNGSGYSATSIAGRFVSFETDRTLVNTPNRLVAALNSPGGAVAGSLAQNYTVAVFHFNPTV